MCSIMPGVGFEPGPTTRQSNTQPIMPIGLSPIGRAVTVASWLGCYTCMHHILFIMLRSQIIDTKTFAMKTKKDMGICLLKDL